MRLRTLILPALVALITPALAGAQAAPPAPSSINPPKPAESAGDDLKPSTRRQMIINEMNVFRISGTVMVEHADKTDPTALQTGSVVEKGDVVTVYDGSWLILKTHRGDEIGFDGSTKVTVDECYMEGPDRQIRLLVDKGTLLLRTNSANSRQSFFEINTGNMVTSIDNVRAIMTFDNAKNTLDIKYIEGKIHVIDQSHEETFTIHQGEYNGYTKSESEAADDQGVPEEHTEHTWLNGKMMEDEAIPMEEIDELNFRKFFDGEPRVAPDDNNMLLDDSKKVPFRQR
jgi:hypothetical protein